MEHHHPDPDWPAYRHALFVATLASTQLLTQASLGQVVVPLKTIGAGFGIADKPGDLSWTIAAYSLTVGIFVLPSGRLGDIHGHRLLLFIGSVWFGLWSLITGFSAFSHSAVFFDFCRAMQGIGPAILLPNAVAILGRTYNPGIKKNMAFAAFAASAPSGFLVGAVFSSLLTTRVWFPWAFWIQGIACALLAVLVLVAIPPDNKEEKHQVTFDWLGTLVALPGLILVNFAWNQAPIQGWDTAYIPVLLGVGLILIAVFFYVETKVKDPLVPRYIWTFEVNIVLGALACGWASFGIFTFYTVRILEDFRHHTYLSVTAQFVPCAISGLIAGIACGLILHRIGPMATMGLALLAFLAALTLVGTMPFDQIYWIQAFLAVSIAPFGMDMSYPSSSIIVSNFCRRSDQGLAMSLVNLIVNYSISIGLGFAGTVEVQLANGNIGRGYRGALYMGMGFAGLGVVLCLGGLLVAGIRSKTARIPDPKYADEKAAEQ